MTINFKYFFIYCLFSIACMISSACGSKQLFSTNFKYAKWDIRFSVDKNRPKEHNKFTFYVSAWTQDTSLLYWLYEDSDFVNKYLTTLSTRKRTQYYLRYDSGYNFVTDKCYDISNKLAKEIDRDLIPLTNIDTFVFERVKTLSDSLRLKDYRALNKAMGFKIYVLPK